MHREHEKSSMCRLTISGVMRVTALSTLPTSSGCFPMAGQCLNAWSVSLMSIYRYFPNSGLLCSFFLLFMTNKKMTKHMKRRNTSRHPHLSANSLIILLMAITPLPDSLDTALVLFAKANNLAQHIVLCA